jgi:hypothetical protein
VQAPTIIRAQLPTPDAVIVRTAGGELLVVADLRLSDAQVDELAREAPHVRDCGRAIC